MPLVNGFIPYSVQWVSDQFLDGALSESACYAGASEEPFVIQEYKNDLWTNVVTEYDAKFFSLPSALQHYAYQIGDNLFYGPTSFEEVGIGELINHSCNPNAGFRSEIQLVAMRYILAGEQVTADYAMCMTTGDFDNWECECGWESCRKKITGDDWKVPELQQKYRGCFQPYIKEKIFTEFNESQPPFKI